MSVYSSLQGLMYGFSIALLPYNILVAIIGVVVGSIIGILPGLGPITAIAVMIPVIAGMNRASAMVLMAGVYYGAIFSASTASILINAPGVSGVVATAFDGFPLAKKGTT